MTYHDLQANKIIDVRRTLRSDVSEDEIYYAVHRVVIGNATWYHHGVLVSDGLDRVCSGLLDIKSSIATEASEDAVITPVFLRSLMSLDEEVIGDVLRQEIAEQIELLRSTGGANEFVVLGLVGDQQMTMFRVSAPDAFTAAANAAEAVHHQHGAEFTPLNVSFAQPVLEELNQHFLKAATDIKRMLGAPMSSMH